MSRPVATVSIPRFLLPQLTWKAPHLKPAAALPASASPRRQRQRSDSPATRSQRHIQELTLSQRTNAELVPSFQRRSLHAQPEPAADWLAISKQSKRPADTQARLSQSIYHALQASLIPQTSRPRLSTSTSPQQTSFAYRSFHSSRPLGRDHHFDTLKFVQRLKDEGFSEEQAAAMMRVLSDVIEESIQNLTRTLVLREDAERATYTQKVDFTKLRSELLSSDNAEASLTRASHERIANDLAKINSRLRDEIGRTQASLRLDLNLEKGRIREEANVQELKIKETQARIEQEVAGLRERVEVVKFSTLQWLMGVCTGTAAIILGAWRLLM